MGNPAIFAGKRTKLLTNKGLLLNSGATVDNDGPKNYVTYGNFENGLSTGWSLNHTTLSSNIPNQASGSWTSAAGTLSTSIVSSGQLAGLYSLSLASSAATTAGDMLVSQAYTIDKEDQGKVLSFKFYYSAITNSTNNNFSGTVSNTWQPYIYDVTNSAWIQPTGVYSISQGSGVGYSYCQWQVPSNMTSFRVAIVCINASTGATTLYFDDIFCGPSQYNIGAIRPPVGTILPYSAATPPTGFLNCDGTAISRSVYAQLFAVIGTTYGAGDGSTTFNLPNTQGIFLRGTGSQTFGSKTYSGTLGTKQNDNMISHTHAYGLAPYGGVGGANQSYYTPSNQGFSQTITSGAAGSGSETYPANLGVNYIICYDAGNVQMSDTSWPNVVAMRANTALSRTLNSSYPTIVYENTDFDTTGSYNSSTGIFTCPVPGIYQVTAELSANSVVQTVSSLTSPVLIKNGTLYSVIGGTRSETVAAAQKNSSGSVLVNCSAGDTLKIGGYSDVANTSVVAAANQNYVCIQRLSGPTTISLTETVAACYNTGSTQSISSSTVINYDNKVYDTHGAVTTGASWKFTAPVSGTYLVDCQNQMANLAWTSGDTYYWQMIHANAGGSTIEGATVFDTKIQASNTYTMMANCTSRIFKLNAGEYIYILGTAARTGGSPTLRGDNWSNWICIQRVGN